MGKQNTSLNTKHIRKIQNNIPNAYNKTYVGQTREQ